MRYAFILLVVLLAAPLAAQNQEWKHSEEIDLGREFTRTIKLEHESFVRVKAVKEAKFQCDFVEGDETYGFSGWRKLLKGDYTVRVASGNNEQGKVQLSVLGASDVDPGEPEFENWRYGVPQKLGAPFQASLLPENDVDYFVVDIEERAYVLVEATTPGQKDPQALIHWLDEEGKRLEPPATLGRELAPGQWVLAVACTAKDLSEPYHVKISLKDTTTLDVNEPNDRRDQSPVIEAGKRLVGALQSSVDADWFCFDAPEDGAVVALLTDPKDSRFPVSINCAVYQRGDAAIEGDGGGFSVGRGKCWLRIGPGAPELVQYALTVYFLKDTTEPNAVRPAQHLHIGMKRETYLPTTADVDGFVFELEADAKLWVECRTAKGLWQEIQTDWTDTSGKVVGHQVAQAYKAGKYALTLRRDDKVGYVSSAYSVCINRFVDLKSPVKPLADTPRIEFGESKAFTFDAEADSTSFQFEAKEAGSVIVKIETSVGVAASPQEFIAYIAQGEGAAMKYTKIDGPTPMVVSAGVYRLLIYNQQGSGIAAGLARVTFMDAKTTILPPAK